jgi:type I restriction enzyme M protein
MSNSRSQKSLQSTLWDAADILRGSAVDRTDWKGYILPLLFFKRISDVWDEEHARMVEEYGEDFEDEHRFQIPDGCHWDDIRSTPQNVGAALKHAMQEIERVNPDTLYRVFGAGDWGNKEKFTDELIKDMIEGFSAIELGNNAVDTDVLGDAYEYLVGKFADVTRRNKAGEFYTPRSVVRMMVETLDPKEGESIYDPACGTGGMLLAAIDHVKRQGGDPRTFFGKIYGQEKNLTTSSVARMNLVLHGIEDFQIAREDTLRNPAFTDGAGGLAKFDCVIANPPFSLKDWGRDIWENDPWGRTQFGLPPDSYGDYAFVQHMIASMAEGGSSRMAVVLPQGALFRKSAEGKIREALLKEDLIEAVIGMAPNLFYGTGLAGCVVVLRRNKPAERKNKVLIIDAQSLFRKGRAQNFLDPEHGEQVVEWFQAFDDVEDRAKVVSLDEIEEEGWTLNISRYVLPPIGEDIPPLPEAVAALKEALTEARTAEDHLRTVLTEGGWLE